MDFKSIQAQIRKKTRMLVKVQCAAVEGIGNAVEICIKLVLNRNVHTAQNWVFKYKFGISLHS